MWIYLAPHLDDVALSVGGLLWEQTHSGERVAVWTIFAGDPPPGELAPFAKELHARWGTDDPMPVRRAEDAESCQRLGAADRHFPFADCIYRRSPVTGEYLYASEASLWAAIHPDDAALIEEIAAAIKRELPPEVTLVCPFGLGGHVDHRLVRVAAERLGGPLLYYADYPYALRAENQARLANLPSTVTAISPEGLLAWQDAVAAHKSQVSTFWKNPAEMRAAIRQYSGQMGGVRLYSGG
jgi:LmbE family N-acetylglucosaminyl deacetylase